MVQSPAVESWIFPAVHYLTYDIKKVLTQQILTDILKSKKRNWLGENYVFKYKNLKIKNYKGGFAYVCFVYVAVFSFMRWC